MYMDRECVCICVFERERDSERERAYQRKGGAGEERGNPTSCSLVTAECVPLHIHIYVHV